MAHGTRNLYKFEGVQVTLPLKIYCIVVSDNSYSFTSHLSWLPLCFWKRRWRFKKWALLSNLIIKQLILSLKVRNFVYCCPVWRGALWTKLVLGFYGAQLLGPIGINQPYLWNKSFRLSSYCSTSFSSFLHLLVCFLYLTSTPAYGS